MTEATPLLLVGPGLALVGLGVGLFQVPNLAQTMAAFPAAEQGVAGGLAFLARTLGSAAGVQGRGAFDAAARDASSPPSTPVPRRGAVWRLRRAGAVSGAAGGPRGVKPDDLPDRRTGGDSRGLRVDFMRPRALAYCPLIPTFIGPSHLRRPAIMAAYF
jgi:hypothetical protein